MVNKVPIELDGTCLKVQAGITVKKALELGGYKVSKYPEPGSLFTPCETGGCWSCAVEVNGQPQRACLTIVSSGLSVKTVLPDDYLPRRIVTGFSGHQVGGVGTPWWLKGAGNYIETAVFAAGCNFRCPQCQNWDITYQSQGKPLSPRNAAERMTEARDKFGVDRMAISGGESTLNRRWLLEYVRELKKLNSDAKARIHIDTNGSILSKDYIDELVEAGMTDVGPDLKGFHLESFMRITGIKDQDLAGKYHSTAWEAVRYLTEEYKDRVFTGVGIPYNRKLISVREIGIMGDRLFKIDPELQVCVLDYRPEFKKMNLVKPGYNEMVKIHKVLSGKGLRTVVCQTKYGHIGPRV